jgi:dTDP-4-amino-4,6-dideoxygalactose transaminase
MRRIRLVDLKAQYIRYQAEFDAAIADVIHDSAFIGGRFVREFEAAFAASYGVRHVIGCANGTDAIYIVLKMLGVGPGDEVVTTAHSWISTSEVVRQCGAQVRFVDTDVYYHLDASKLEASLSDKTRVVIPVHLFGQPADLDAIAAICRRRAVTLIEDCAQAHYATLRGERVGTIGHAATFSFYPGKNLGAWGDAGAIITNDDQLAERCRMYANHGALEKHHHQIDGINSRLDGLQAALLTAKLRHIGKWTEERCQVAKWYDECLSRISVVVRPTVRPYAKHVWHLYVVQVPDRVGLQRHLLSQGIETAVHYPTALPLLPPYRCPENSAARFPNAAANQDRILSLPMFPEMSRADVEYVAACIDEYYRAAS